MFIFLIGIILLGAVMYALISSTGRKGNKHRTNNVDREMVRRRWTEIQGKLNHGGESALGSAVADADKLFDYVLKQNGYPGSTFAERLKRAESRLSDKQAVWRAHKLRNAIAHEVKFDVVAGQVRQALNGYERGLRDLGALV